MAAMFGGVVGQEVMKAASGKFHPLYQFFYFDSIESLPEEALSPEDVAPLVRHRSHLPCWVCDISALLPSSSFLYSQSDTELHPIPLVLRPICYNMLLIAPQWLA